MSLRRILSICTLTLALAATACSGPGTQADNESGSTAATTDTAGSGAEPAPPPDDPAPVADRTTTPPNPDQAQPDEAEMTDPNDTSVPAASKPSDDKQIATFGGGCFWCTEAVLEQLDGVLAVESGYMGGDVDDPTYEQVCSGTTNHAEVVQVTFDPKVITYESLLDWFFRSHDPTTLNRQGADVGTQYRSVVFFHDDEQKRTTEKFIASIAPNWGSPIVTQVAPADTFWSAEKYHQDYYRNNSGAGYCRAVIAPKLKKLDLDVDFGQK